MKTSHLALYVLFTCGNVFSNFPGVHAQLMDGDFYLTEDYRDHPCNRVCEDDAPPRVCQYYWLVENYWTMSKACMGCPYNQSDCFKPHCVSADGVQRGIVTVSRMLPGPSIEVCEGDSLVIKVHNELVTSEGVSIHWHGLLQRGTPHMDGVSMVTQCPVMSRSSFTYRFQAVDPGTHYWHGHAGTHRADGLFGAFVVRQPPSREPHGVLYDLDLSEHVIIVHDWLKTMTLSRYLKHYHSDRLIMPSQMLINGLGAYEEFKAGNSSVFTPRASFTVQAGKRYRFRVISSSVVVCPIQLSIDNHTLVVIASDGNPIEPIEVDSLFIVSGERYDFVLNTHDTNSSRSFWIRARGDSLCAPNQAHQMALLRYDGAPEVDPPEPRNWTSSIREGTLLNPWNGPNSGNDVEVTRMRAVDTNDSMLTSVPDKTFHFAMGFYRVDSYWFNHPEHYPQTQVTNDTRSLHPQMNGISSRNPPSPPLTQFDDVAQVEVTLGDLVEIVLVGEGNFVEANHPFHLHGYKFRVLAMGKLNTSTTIGEVKALDKQGLITRTASRAPWKDTVTVPDGGYVVLRFRADNPGMWMFHCHNILHTINGMAVIIQVGQKSDFPEFPKNFPKCGSWNEPVYEEDEHDGLHDVVYCMNFPRNGAVSQSVVRPVVIVVAVAVVLGLWSTHP